MNLLDIGCNNGVITALSHKYFQKVVGIESKYSLYQKSLDTREIFQKFDSSFNNVVYRNQSFYDYVVSGNFDRDGINAIIGCQVLYHLTDREIDELIGVLDTTDWILATSHIGRSKSNNKFRLQVPSNMKSFLRDCGFPLVHGFKKSSKYPIFVAHR